MTLTQVRVPAFRLRPGDRLTGHAGAEVTHAPAFATDRSTVTIIMVDKQQRIRAVPVHPDAILDARRKVSGLNVGPIESTRVAKSSGTRVQVLDLTDQESTIISPNRESYATRCVAHSTLAFYTGISTARARASHPEVWCHDCHHAVASRANERVYGKRAR